MSGSELNSTHALVHTDTHCICTYTYIHLSRTHTQTYIFSAKGRTVNDFIFSPRQSWCFPFIFPSMSFVEVPRDLIKWKSSLVPALDILPRQVVTSFRVSSLGSYMAAACCSVQRGCWEVRLAPLFRKHFTVSYPGHYPGAPYCPLKFSLWALLFVCLFAFCGYVLSLPARLSYAVVNLRISVQLCNTLLTFYFPLSLILSDWEWCALSPPSSPKFSCSASLALFPLQYRYVFLLLMQYIYFCRKKIQRSKMKNKSF